ncbi:MAG TPA: glycogen debranching enzyme N-terminal domain-containing protein, partial [Polyangiaceae bacterium]|nr:glycogen debranching enzyme N-terminal domain-containing protein [Polyangiaceae bacterium]
MNESATRIGYRRGEEPESLLEREWLVTNGLGGYACGSLSGALTRRFHGLLIAALPPPLGRTLMLNQIREELYVGDTAHCLTGQEPMNGDLVLPGSSLDDFSLELGLPVWRYRCGNASLEKRIFMPHLSNSTVVIYRLLESPGPVRLRLSPAFNVRVHEGALARAINVDEHGTPEFPFALRATRDGLEIAAGDPFPAVHLLLQAGGAASFVAASQVAELLYRVERSRGYDFHGPVFSPGYYEIVLEPGTSATLLASTAAWPELEGMAPEALLAVEQARRKQLLEVAHPAVQQGLG